MMPIEPEGVVYIMAKGEWGVMSFRIITPAVPEEMSEVKLVTRAVIDPFPQKG
jgi:hypothetical protein